ncbi:GNAT family N-acetyltransferase [Streptomyces sp. NBC_00525]|uniref:GNAT family N-acetyltransferase n=1 Tax=Streptomyces sp. NBC_00525 TaxID=2903660 RepID=UPI002E800FC0|nr:GNAT family N-acetyltransferase [Streptomyces sp. NBC_00525]WUC93825.1 GNAT family N-acetyltransferase [Streptomyces sp. NBC_00525]
MSPHLTLGPLAFLPDEIADVVDLYAGNPAYWQAAGEHDPEHIEAAKVEADLRAEAAVEGGEVLLGRDEEGRVVGIVCLLARHPVDGLPWIGLLMVSGDSHRTGIGRQLVALIEQRYRAEGRRGLRLAVLENNPDAVAFWHSLGWREIDRRTDRAHGRPCIVMHKPLT